MSDLLDFARLYAECGLSVLSWKYKERSGKWDKVPTHPWRVGVVPRMTDSHIIERWNDVPDANIGIITGAPSGVVIVDADDAEAEAWVRSKTPYTPWQITTGRGTHFGFRYPDAVVPAGQYIQNAQRLDGYLLDLRADRGFAAMPPSLHKSGRNYEWAPESGDDLVEMLQTMPVFDLNWFNGVKLSGQLDTGDSELDWTTPSLGGDFTAARNWLITQPGAVSGERGRDVTFRVAATLCRDYGLSLLETLSLMEEWNTRCSPPWSTKELRGKIEDAYIKGTSPIGHRGGVDAAKVLTESFTGAAPRNEVMASAIRETRTETPPQNKVESAPQNIVMDAVVPGKSLTEDKKREMDNDADKIAAENIVSASMKDAGVAFSDENIAHAVRLSMHNQQLFFKLKHDLKGLVDVRSWSKAVKSAEAKLRRMSTTHSDSLTTEGARVEVDVTADQRDIRDGVLRALVGSDGIYIASGKLSHIIPPGKVEELCGGTLHNFIANNCRVIRKTQIADIGTVDVPAAVPSQVISMLENLLWDQSSQFREIERVVKTPFFTQNGQLISEVGYSPEAKTLLLDTPPIELEQFTDAQDAIDFIRGVFGDFPFQNEGEFTNYLGTLLTPILRAMYRGPTPWIVVEANVPKAGKTLLASCVMQIHGLDPDVENLPTKEEEIVKTMMGVLMQAKPIVLFDNVKHAVDSPCVEMIATCRDRYTGRILGTNEMRTSPVRLLVLVTANNMTTSEDSARRFQRIRLKLLPTRKGENRQLQIPNLTTFIEQYRPNILSALLKIAKTWVDAGCPLYSAVPRIESYEAYCSVIGSCLHHVGMTDWWSNFADAKKTWSINNDWPPFFHVWQEEYNRNGPTDRSAKELLELATRHQLLNGALSRAADTNSRMALFQRKLNDLRDWDDGTHRVVLVEKPNGQTSYRLEPSFSD